MAEQENPLTLAFTISVDGNEAGTQEFQDEMVTIGKGAAAVLQIEDPDLADLHAAVQLTDDGSVTLLDLGSEGGTLLNGEKINNSPVSDGDEIRLGKTVITLGLIQPVVEEEVAEAAGDADNRALNTQERHEAEAAEEIAEAEDVIDFILRSGTAESDLGIDRKAPPVLEVAEIWSGTVMNVRHYNKDVPAVYVGDRRNKQIRILSSLFVAILVFGVGFFMLKHANLPEPPKYPEGDEALLQQWQDRDTAEKEKLAAERKAKREAERKALEEAADERIAKNQRKYDREAQTRFDDEKKENEETTKTLADFVEAVRDDVINEVREEQEAAEAEEREKNAPPNPYRDYRDEWVAEKKTAFEKEQKRAQRPLLPPQFELYEQPNYEDMVINQMLPLAKEAVKTGDLKKSWQDEFDKWTKEYDVLDDLDVKRVAEDLVLGTRVLLNEDEVWTLTGGLDPNKVYAVNVDGDEKEIPNEDELQLWSPSQEQVDARLAAFKDIQQLLYLQNKAKKSSRGQCAALKELLEFDDFKNEFEYNARYSKCLADKSKFDPSREYFERALENLPGPVAELSDDNANSYQTALTVKARTLLRDAYGGDPAKAGTDLLPIDKRERAMDAWQDLRGFIMANTQQVNDLKQADHHINMLEKERLKEKQQEQVLNAIRLGLVILFLLPIGFGVDEVRSRKMAQDFFVSSENLPNDHWPIVEQDAAGVKVNFTKESIGFMEAGGERTSTSDLIASGRAKDAGGFYQVDLNGEERFINDIGHMVFFIHRVHKAKVIPAPVGGNVDWLYLGILAALLFIGAGLGVRLLTMPYDPSQEVITIPDRFVELMVQDIEKEKDKKKPAGNPDAGEGAKAKDEEGKTGKKEAKLKKAKGSKVAIQKSELDKKIAESTGLLADLNNMTDTSIFGTGGLDNSVSNAVGGLLGSQYGNQMGAGGLGSRGSGLGGGGTAEGLGGLGTKGRGSGASGYGRGGGYYGQKGGGAPGVGAGDPIILGALDKSIIDRIVKKHLPQIRYCYQKELNKNPKLFGKMVVKFVIAKDGSVSSSSTKTSTLKNPIVENCVHSRFMRMRFPQPKGGGIVIVSYPFVFNSQGG